MATIDDKFEIYDDEYQNFDLIKNKRSKYRDLHALLLLESLFPPVANKIINNATHEEIALSISLTQIKTLTIPQIQELSRCGVSFDSDFECLRMYL